MGRVAAWIAGPVACMAVALTFVRLHFGVDFADESYYVGLAYRLYLGDRPFVDELHLAQTAALIVRPFVAMFCELTGGTEGVVLYTRKLYLALNCIVAASVFFALRKRIETPVALTTCLLCVVFIPFSIPNLSYNSLGSGLFTLGIFLALNGIDAGRRPWFYLLTGTVHGLAVLAYPSLLLPATVFAAALAAGVAQGRVHTVIAHGIGGAVIGGLSLASIGIAGLTRGYEFMTLRYLDQQGKLAGVLSELWSSGVDKRLVLAGFALLWWQGRKRPALAIASLPLLPLLVSSTLWGDSYPWRDGLLFMSGYGLIAPLLLPLLWHDRSMRELFGVVWLPSLIAGLTMAWSSSNGAVNAGLGMVPAALVTSIYLYEVLREALDRTTYAKLALIRLLPSLLVVLVLLGFQRIVYFEGNITSAQQEVTWGPFKGLRTTDERNLLLQSLADDLQPLVNETGRIVFYDHFPAGYLLTSMRPATPSLWACFRLAGEQSSELCSKHYEERLSDDNIAVWITNLEIPGPALASGSPERDERMHDVVTSNHDLLIDRTSAAGAPIYRIYSGATSAPRD